MATAQALFLLAGAAAGLAEVRLLRRSVLAARPNPFGLSLRLSLVGAVLVAAAALHCLVAALLGWAGAMALATVVSASRWS